MLMLSRHNLLVLDEPTNHLDVESIEALEDAVERYEGTVILVSHDRELLRALTTRVWVLHDLHITEFDGGFAEWEVVSAERAHAASVRAAEEEALRRVHERQKVARSGTREKAAGTDKRRQLKAAEAELARLEIRVAESGGSGYKPHGGARGPGALHSPQRSRRGEETGDRPRRGQEGA